MQVAIGVDWHSLPAFEALSSALRAGGHGVPPYVYMNYRCYSSALLLGPAAPTVAPCSTDPYTTQYSGCTLQPVDAGKRLRTNRGGD